MSERVAAHYGGEGGESGDLAATVAAGLRAAGKDLAALTTHDLAAVDEFHIRGRAATLELAARMNLTARSRVLDIGSGLGGPARTVAEAHGCHVTGIDLTPAFCAAATALSGWVGLGGRTAFMHGDATALPFAAGRFDAAMTLHVAMNIAAKDRLYAEARRVLRPGGVLAIYDVLQGAGGEVLYPVPWAREPSISHLATAAQMRTLLAAAGFAIVEETDSTAAGEAWFAAVRVRLAQSGPPPVSFQAFLGGDYVAMVANQVRNLAERRIATVSYICRAL